MYVIIEIQENVLHMYELAKLELSPCHPGLLLVGS